MTEFNLVNIQLSPVKAVSISQNNHYIASATSDNILKIWNMETKEKHLSVEFSSESKISLKFSFGSEYLFISNTEQEMIVWSTEANKFENEKTMKIYTSNSFSVSNDNKFIASVYKISCLSVWNSETKSEEYKGNFNRCIVNSSVFISNDLRKLFLSIRSSVEIWDFQKAREVGTIQKLADYVFPIKFSKNGKYAVHGHEKKISVWIVDEN